MRVRAVFSDASGAVADLGVLVPIVAALVLRNGLDAGTVLVGAGALYMAAGLYFGVPFPVQPVKAAAAIAIARDLPPSTLSAAGLVLGAALVVLGLTGAAGWLERVFTKPIVRGIQLGVGLILVRAAFHLSPHPTRSIIGVALVLAAVLVVIAREREARVPLALLVVAGGVAWSLAHAHAPIPWRLALWRPHAGGDVFGAHTLWTAFTLLVVPQIPLTFGNAVVALADLEHRYFGTRAARVSPASVSLSCGIANVVVGTLGGMPMCHGSGGLTAHYRAGARSSRMNVFIGGALLALGLVAAPAALGLLALIPLAVLMAFLIFTGVLHAALVADLRGRELALAAVMGVAGLLTSNLAVSLAIGLIAVWPVRATRAALRRA